MQKSGKNTQKWRQFLVQVNELSFIVETGADTELEL